ncbi:MAG: UDP-3-O-acyl-N-acetylglucosamine deacetylase, partial [Elusimicrobiota bacterium]|nr:UDP-3-O-acyl-N-acetylglucosamine deacetylase [Elusimicrobiota bacterium]
MDYQRTIKNEISASGIGLHTANLTKITFKPAPINSGIRFVRTDLKDKPEIIALYQNVLGVIRGTTIGLNKEIVVYTVEHLLSALFAFGIDNLIVELDNNEPPVFDGSAKRFVEMIKEAGIIEQEAEKKFIVLREPIKYFVADKTNTVEITAYPSAEFKVDYSIVYEHPLVGKQQIGLTLTPENFETEISSARTFCFDYEIEALKKIGLAKGGGLENTIVIGVDRIYSTEKLRYEDEFVRHKLLDLIGDLALLGRQIKAHIVVSRSGHKHNINFIKKIVNKISILNHEPCSNLQRGELGIEEIKKIIPHREPFLLIDKVIIIEPEKSAIGYKHLTGLEDFFRGHFPGNPIMPGVLIIEALAQTACVLFLSRPDLSDKV